MILWASFLLFVASANEVGNAVCAQCHAAIARTYAVTGMARTAGAVTAETAIDGQFAHAASGVQYRMVGEDGGLSMQFSRSGSDWSGARRLEWFLGSGGLGRSYLFSLKGFLFQAPVSYYSSAKRWQISPGYERLPRMDLTRPVESACLQCHASRLQPVTGTQNGFDNPPFQEAGVSCERCHGPGQAHVEAMRRGAKPGAAIVNPAKLPAEARDSVCAQCHLTGAARVARRNIATARYQPGAKLSDTLAVFVWPQVDGSPDATSHYERLNQSACKKAAGDRLWCGSCHEPHSSPADAVAHYRAKCQNCHASRGCTEKAVVRKARGEDCASCHMPKGESHMVEHVAFTDHGIVRKVQPSPATRGARELLSFFAASDDRDLALGYAVTAMTEPAVRRRALELLEAAAARDANDVAVLAQLAQFRERMGRADLAEPLYRRILAVDANHSAAAVNLGIAHIKRGETAQAIALWQRALSRNPAQTGARTNLAVALAQSGNLADAEAALLKALEHDPDAEAPRRLLEEIRARR
ncbi:MAG: tetratricopeptide repeat protein [Bryobacterales bacterium]|nr:tetratricopeptide repeat protein [Bryobacterales bacterium]